LLLLFIGFHSRRVCHANADADDPHPRRDKNTKTAHHR
jgi:hypothetical protein